MKNRDRMNYREIVVYLEDQKKFNTVEYVKSCLDRLGLEINPDRVIVVAGTNGKGTTCATLQTLLYASGKNVGLFSSPHMEKINERIKFNDADIPDEAFCEVFHYVREKIGDLSVSHFEWLMLMAVYYFFGIHGDRVDFAIFEVGLGGTLDATNAIPHSRSVITKLGMDHEDVLGNSLEQIAENKFGIIKQNNTVFHMKFPDEIQKIAQKYAKKLGATFIESEDFSLSVDRSGKYPVFFLEYNSKRYRMNLPGARAAENTALAATIFDNLVNDAQKYLPAISKVSWPCRMEILVYGGRDIFLSGDHNLQGVDSLLEIIKFFSYRNIRFVVGICKGKNHDSMLNKLFSVPNAKIYLTKTTFHALEVVEYAEKFREMAEFVSSNFIEALNSAVGDAKSDDLVIVTGSLYLTGTMKAAISRK